MKTKKAVALFLAPFILAASVQAASVDWTVMVSADETTTTQSIQNLDFAAALYNTGGRSGINPPTGTTRFHVSFYLPGGAGCYPYGAAFYNVPHTGGTYSVFYTRTASGTNTLTLYRGNVGGELLRQDTFYSSCTNGYSWMNVSFTWMVSATTVQTRTAADSGTLWGEGGPVTAAWSAAPESLSGNPLGNYRTTVTGSNSDVTLRVETDSSQTAGTVTASFPAACVPSAEVCDGVDNDCDGQVDEFQGVLSCGAGACFTTTPACYGGETLTCEPLPPVAETCDGVDNDCNGAVDEGLGSASCGVGQCAHQVANCSGGQAGVCDPMAGASTEVCGDLVDNDCDGIIDNNCNVLDLVPGEAKGKTNDNPDFNMGLKRAFSNIQASQERNAAQKK